MSFQFTKMTVFTNVLIIELSFSIFVCCCLMLLGCGWLMLLGCCLILCCLFKHAYNLVFENEIIT